MAIFINLNPQIPVIPRNLDKTQVDVRYMVLPPFASVHIFWDQTSGELVYELEEPILNDQEKQYLGILEKSMMESMNVSPTGEGETVTDYVDRALRAVISEKSFRIDEASYNKLFYYMYRDFVGLNQIEGLMHDYFIEDLECNGVGEPIYIVHRVFRNIKTNVKFDSVEGLASFVEKLAQKCGRYVSYASPLLDGTLPDGSRVNATYTKDITSKGPTYTIRKFTKTPWTPIQLISMRNLSPEMLAYLWMCAEYEMNMMIAGATASGKTTLLNAIAFFIPPDDRVVSIEDTRELQLPRENWVPSVARAGVAGAGEVDMFSLLKNSFRQNPDYVIVGEVRGQEAFVLFQGMSSGHASISTVHADSVEGVIRRLETPPISLNPSLLNALDIVIVMTHALVNGQETRKLREIVEITSVTSEGVAVTNTPFVWDPASDKFFFKKDSRVFEKIEKRHGIAKEQLFKEHALRTKLLFQLYKQKVTDFDELGRIVKDYYRTPLDILKKYGVE